MSEKLVMKDIERRVYMFYTEDGLIDLAIGLVILGFGGLLFLDFSGFTGVLGLVPVGLWYLGKRVITLPRIGTIQPDKAMGKRLAGFLSTMVVIGAAVGVMAFLLAESPSQLSDGHPLMMFALVLSLAISALGLVMKVARLYFYAILVFLALSIGEGVNGMVEGPDFFVLSVICTGIIILLTGTGVLFRFLQKYPVVNGEA